MIFGQFITRSKYMPPEVPGPSLPIRPPTRGAETAAVEHNVRMLDIEISITRRKLALMNELRNDLAQSLANPDGDGESS